MSTQEKLFTSLVSKLICKKVSFPAEREKQLISFYNLKELHYDNFCESVYILMSTNNISTISLDDFGYTRHDTLADANGIGYELLSKEDISSPYDDVIVYIELGLKRLQERLEVAEDLKKTLYHPVVNHEMKLS